MFATDFRCPECEGEIFQYGRYQWDVEKAWQLIRKYGAPLVTLDIGPYAEGMLLLTREGVIRENAALYTIGIDVNRVRTMPPEITDIPGSIVQIRLRSGKTLSVVIDGNHRLARRYLDGIDTMEFYMFNEGQDTPFLMRAPLPSSYRTPKG